MCFFSDEDEREGEEEEEEEGMEGGQGRRLEDFELPQVVSFDVGSAPPSHPALHARERRQEAEEEEREEEEREGEERSRSNSEGSSIYGMSSHSVFTKCHFSLA